MDEKPIKLVEKLKSFVLCAIVFTLIYNFTAWYSSTLDFVPSFVFNFEKQMPFISYSILPYFTSSLFFLLAFLYCKTKVELYILRNRILLISGIAGICFLVFPLKFSFIKPEPSEEIFQLLFQFLKEIDSPFNQSPSLHVTFALIFWSVFRNLKSNWRHIVAFLLLIMALSTLTTFQHHLLDIISGAILAQFGFIVFPIQKNNFQFRNFHIANYYFLFAWCNLLVTLLLIEFYGRFWIILLWLTFLLFTLGFHYQKNNIHFLKNRFGKINLFKKIVYFPYLMTYLAFWKLLIKNKEPKKIIPQIYISSMLDAVAIQKFKFNKDTFVYDLSAELQENSLIIKEANYFCNPFLDIGTFNTEQTKKLVLEITEQYKKLPKQGKILIHCTMGYSRSAVIGILVVKNILSLPTEEAIALVSKANKHTQIHKHLHEFLNKIQI